MNSHTSIVIKDEKIFEEIKKIARREGRDVSELTFDLYEKHVKVHGEGNPVYTLDKFQDPNFKAFPAIMENIDVKWIPHLQNRTDKELDEIIEQAEKIFHYASAYRSINKFDRVNTWFGTQKDAEAQARF